MEIIRTKLSFNTDPPHPSLAGFHVQIHKFLFNDDGSVQQEDEEARFEEKFFLPKSMFGSARHRSHVALLLHQAGWPQQSHEPKLKAAFSKGKSILKRLKKIGIHRSGIPLIKFYVKKYVRCEDELQEFMALPLSIQEAPKPVPAKCIQALKKVKLEGDISEECMICMGQLSSGTEVTSMPCSHLFHGDCIQKWLNTSHKCPLCRLPMPTDC